MPIFFRIIKVRKFSRRGIALFLVMGLLVVFVPVLLFLSQMGGSQVKQSVKFHESLQVESAALSGSNSGYSRLRGNNQGLQQFSHLAIGDQYYDLTIKPTGQGLFTQNLYYIFSKSIMNKHQYILMNDSEQFPPDPNPPVTVITHDVWNTLEPYDINNAADVTSMENFRGQDLLEREDALNFERSKTKSEYQTFMVDKQTQDLPIELNADWNSISVILADEKLPKS